MIGWYSEVEFIENLMSIGKLKIALLVFCIGLLYPACRDKAADNQEKEVVFEFETTGNEHFVARTSDPVVIENAREQLSQPEDKRNLFISGKIARGREQNTRWNWHFVPDKWDLVETSIEVCDGRPSFVEQNLDYWVDEVGRFCPWSSRVLKEVENADLLF